MMNWKSLLVGLLLNMGKPRYLPKDLLAQMAKQLASLSTISWRQFDEQMTWDLRVLTFCPDLQLNSYKISIMVVKFLVFDLQKESSHQQKRGLDLCLNALREPFHTHDEDVRRHGIYMSNVPTRIEKFSISPINQDRDRSGGYT